MNSSEQKTVMLFPWEQQEYVRHIEELHNERHQKEFLLKSILRIATAINDRDPITCAELLDVIEDCVHQINTNKEPI